MSEHFGRLLSPTEVARWRSWGEQAKKRKLDVSARLYAFAGNQALPVFCAATAHGNEIRLVGDPYSVALIFPEAQRAGWLRVDVLDWDRDTAVIQSSKWPTVGAVRVRWEKLLVCGQDGPDKIVGGPEVYAE